MERRYVYYLSLWPPSFATHLTIWLFYFLCHTAAHKRNCLVLCASIYRGIKYSGLVSPMVMVQIYDVSKFLYTS